MLSQFQQKPAPSLLLGPYPQRKAEPARTLTDTIEAAIAALLLRRKLRPARLTAQSIESESSPMSRVLSAWESVRGEACEPAIVAAALALLEDRTLIELHDHDACERAAIVAACSMALRGLPVHLVYADAPTEEGDLAALGQRLGLKVAAVEDGADIDSRRASYGADIVAVSCRQLLFDYLLDQKSLGSARGQIASRLKLQLPEAGAVLLPGLSCALIVDAREVLIEQAKRPVGISEPGERDASHVDSFHSEAVDIARQLVAGEDYVFEGSNVAPVMTDAGRDKLQALCAALGPLWCGQFRSQAIVAAALIAATMEARVDFEFRGEEIALLKSAADLICEEGIGPSDYRKLLAACHDKPAAKAAMPVKTRLSVQHLFPRYMQLAACGWVLKPRLAELQQVYGLVALKGFNTQQAAQPRVSVFASRTDWQMALFERLATLQHSSVNVLIITPDDEAQASLQGQFADQPWGDAVCASGDEIPAVVSGLMLSCTMADALAADGNAQSLSFQQVIFAGTPGSLLDQQLFCHGCNDGCDIQVYACSSDSLFELCSTPLRALSGYSVWLHNRLRRQLETKERKNRDQVAAHDAYLRQALAFSGETL